MRKRDIDRLVDRRTNQLARRMKNPNCWRPITEETVFKNRVVVVKNDKGEFNVAFNETPGAEWTMYLDDGKYRHH